MSTTTATDLATRYEVAVREIKQLRASLAEAARAHRAASAENARMRDAIATAVEALTPPSAEHLLDHIREQLRAAAITAEPAA